MKRKWQKWQKKTEFLPFFAIFAIFASLRVPALEADSINVSCRQAIFHMTYEI
jgi:hypothetical protein